MSVSQVHRQFQSLPGKDLRLRGLVKDLQNGHLSSSSALFVAPRTPIFPGFSRMVARLFANPRGPVGFQELKNTSFFQAFLVTRDYNMGKSRALRYSTKPSSVPARRALSTTMRFATEPRTVRFPAS